MPAVLFILSFLILIVGGGWGFPMWGYSGLAPAAGLLVLFPFLLRTKYV